MVHIYTFCDKTLLGKKFNLSAKFLSENMYKLNFKIEEVCVFCNNYDYENLTFKNNDIYFLLLQKSNSKLNSVLANLSGCELTTNESLKNTTTNYYKQLNLPMDKTSELECIIPSKAVAITNPNGKTQGFYVKVAESYIFVLPNNFNEFKSIYNDCLLEYIENNFAIEYKSETYKTFGLSEDYIFEVLKEQIKNKDKVHISIFSRGLDNDIVIKAKQGNELFQTYRQVVFNKLEKYIYSVQDLSLNNYLENLIKTSNVKLSLIGDLSVNNILNNVNVNINNISSIICLPNVKSKLKFGISNDLIQTYGEASAEVAYALAVKSLENNDCDLALAVIMHISNNVATSYIALGNKLKIDIYKNTFQGDNNSIFDNVANAAKFYLIKKLNARDYKTL
ncbi:MAG: hypothetical protein E7376_00105 [Clostridiales bacterium]|nr:hypothetical protein [Clostridiales bacterium]